MPAQDQGVSNSAGRYILIPRTLCFVTHDREVLLIKGAPDKKIFPGRYNGVGGHVERDEDIFSAAIREVREETGLAVTEFRLRGVINIDTGEAAGIGLFVFTARADGREVRASSEGILEWVAFDQVNELDLVEDLPMLLPKVLGMKDDEMPFSARYHYGTHGKLIADFGG
ncbi:MAG: NUDIX domain-containing protein [Chloroflexi bacterium]|nr:NUDIX domain-containing protein [Chloroflexota bacterium]